MIHNLDSHIVEFEEDYLRNAGLYQDLARCISQDLEHLLSGIKIHSITHRVKKLDSLKEKIKRKLKESSTSPEINDIIGVRIVCLFIDDLEKIDEIINANFKMLSSENKTEESPVNHFGYTSRHYICELAESNEGIYYNRLKGIKFEIQTRTILMDAWANVSHHIEYKKEISAPSELRRDFNALSALFHIADKQFMAFRDQTQSYQKELQNLDVLNQKINHNTLKKYLEDKFQDRETAEDSAYSTVSKNLMEIGFDTIRQIDNIVNKNLSAASKDETENPPREDGIDYYDQFGDPAYKETKYNTIGILSVCLSIDKYEIWSPEDSTPYSSE